MRACWWKAYHEGGAKLSEPALSHDRALIYEKTAKDSVIVRSVVQTAAA